MATTRPNVERDGHEGGRPGGGDAGLPLVSVIVPTYNRADVLAETIESVFAQTYPRIEFIVIDDGSTDDTAAVVDRYGDRLISIRQPGNQGLAAARNVGFLRSSGDLVAWLDHDDLWNPEKIGLEVAFMQRYPDCVLVAGDFSAFDAEGFFERSHARAYYSAIDKTPGGLAGIFPERVLLSTREVPFLPAGMPENISVFTGHIYDKLVWGNCLHPPTALMTRAVSLKAGFLDGRFGNDVDYEYILRVSKLGRVAYIDHPLIRYRYSEGQLSSDKNLAKIALSLLTVLESLCEKEPALRDSRAFRRRIASSHLAAAHALADKERGPALRHLLRSLAAGVVDLRTATTVAKLCLPRFVVQGYRERRHERSRS